MQSSGAASNPEHTVAMGAKGATPLFIACQKGYVVIVAMLLDAGAAVNQVVENTKASALHVAARHGHVGIVRALLQAGADVAMTTANGHDAMQISHANGHTDTHRDLQARFALCADWWPWITKLWCRVGLDADERRAPCSDHGLRLDVLRAPHLAAYKTHAIPGAPSVATRGGDPEHRFCASRPCGAVGRPAMRGGGRTQAQAAIRGDLSSLSRGPSTAMRNLPKPPPRCAGQPAGQPAATAWPLE